MSAPESIDSFISRWENSGAAERANYQMFLSELCDLLDVPRPDPTSPDPENNLYVFDRAITRINPDGLAVTNSIDLYAEFTCTGGRYERFPDPKNHRPPALRRPARHAQ